MSKYKVIDLFAGVGGLSYGFAHNENFEIVMANEYVKDIATAYRMNHPTVNVIQGDIRDITEEQLKAVMGNNGIDIIIGDLLASLIRLSESARWTKERTCLKNIAECFLSCSLKCLFLRMFPACLVCRAVN